MNTSTQSGYSPWPAWPIWFNDWMSRFPVPTSLSVRIRRATPNVATMRTWSADDEDWSASAKTLRSHRPRRRHCRADRNALRRIESALYDLGAARSDVIRTRIFVTDISQWRKVGAVHAEFEADAYVEG